MTYRRAVAALAVILLASACAGTNMRDSWVAPDFQKASVKKVLVLGIAANPGIRRSYEDKFAADLRGRGYEAIPGYLWVPDATKLDKDAVVARMKEEGVTHVLVTRLVSTQKVEHHEASASNVVVTVGVHGYGPGYGSWSTYYTTGYGDTSYTTVDDVVTLETNLYDAARKQDDELVWSGHSETWVDGPATESKIKSVISAIVYRMRADKVL